MPLEHHAPTQTYTTVDDLLFLLHTLANALGWPIISTWKALWGGWSLQVFNTTERRMVILIGPYGDMVDADYRKKVLWLGVGGLVLYVLLGIGIKLGAEWWALGLCVGGYVLLGLIRGYILFFDDTFG